MGNELIKKNFKNIANSIRAKTGKNGTLTAEEMPAEIEAELAKKPEGSLSITENGTGIDVSDKATVDVNVAGYPEPTGTKNITTNGTHDVKDFASANVNVPNPSAGSLNITENGNYDVTEKAEVNVEVPVPEHEDSVEAYEYYQGLRNGNYKYDDDALLEKRRLVSNEAYYDTWYLGSGYNFYYDEDGSYPFEKQSSGTYVSGGIYEANGSFYALDYGEYAPQPMGSGDYFCSIDGGSWDKTSIELEVGESMELSAIYDSRKYTITRTE